jgi:hypothetical protein
MYHNITNFKLSSQLEHQLFCIDWKSLPIATVFGRKEFLYNSYVNHFMFDAFKYYGLVLQKIGTMVSPKLPDKLEWDVRNEIKQQWGELLCNEVIIRLQIVYGGTCIPIHIDKTRNSSIIYPILHPHASSTEFYEYNGPDIRGVLSPRWCKLTQQVIIDKTPVLLDTRSPHAIRYSRGTYTKKDPRISLSLKFEKLDFQTVATLVK